MSVQVARHEGKRSHLISNSSRNRRQKSACGSVLITRAFARIHVKVAAGEDDG
jgi:hypothetical protein